MPMGNNVFGQVYGSVFGDVFGVAEIAELIPVCVGGQMNTRLEVSHDVQTRLKVDGHASTRLSVEMGRLICR